MDSPLALFFGLFHWGSSDTTEELDSQELTDSWKHLKNLFSQLSDRSQDDGLGGLLVHVNSLQGSDDECTSLSSSYRYFLNGDTWLSLSYGVLKLNYGLDGFLLDGGGSLKTVGKDSSK